MTDICITEPKQRRRPKKNKTPEEIEQDRLKKNDYHNNYHKMRKQRDQEYAERNKEKNKIKREEILRKSKLYDEMLKNVSL